jgi:hypothetical protein
MTDAAADFNCHNLPLIIRPGSHRNFTWGINRFPRQRCSSRLVGNGNRRLLSGTI